MTDVEFLPAAEERRPFRERGIFHGLVFPLCWEDPAVDAEALQISSTDVVLSITSAGCNVLNLLLQNPRSLISVDLNPAQNALLELKIAALRTSDWQTFSDLFAAENPHRIGALYANRFRPLLSTIAARFWDRHLGLMSRNLYLRGRMGSFFRVIRAFLWSRGIGPVELAPFSNCPALTSSAPGTCAVSRLAFGVRWAHASREAGCSSTSPGFTRTNFQRSWRQATSTRWLARASNTHSLCSRYEGTTSGTWRPPADLDLAKYLRTSWNTILRGSEIERTECASFMDRSRDTWRPPVRQRSISSTCETSLIGWTSRRRRPRGVGSRECPPTGGTCSCDRSTGHVASRDSRARILVRKRVCRTDSRFPTAPPRMDAFF